MLHLLQTVNKKVNMFCKGHRIKSNSHQQTMATLLEESFVAELAQISIKVVHLMVFLQNKFFAPLTFKI